MLAVKQTDSRPVRGMSLRGNHSKLTPEKVDEIGADFEAQFISQMLGTMFSTVERDEETGGGDAEEVYNSMLQNEYGKLIARTGGVGVADQVKQMMIKQQEVE